MFITTGERLYVKWTPTPATSAPLEVSFDRGTTWHALTAGVEDSNGVWTADVAGTVHALLVASPCAAGNPAGTVVLPAGYYAARIRYVDNPEILIRDAGAIVVS